MTTSFDNEAYLARIAEADRERNTLLAMINGQGFASFSALPKDAMERLANEYADAEMARIDTDRSRTDIEVHERWLSIDDAEIRAAFDEQLVLERAGLVDPDTNWSDADAWRWFIGVHAAELRNPAPEKPSPPPPAYVNDPNFENNLARTTAHVEHALFSRDALRKHFYTQRYEALRTAQLHEHYDTEREQRQQSVTRANLAVPVVIEGELLPATRRRSR